MRTYHLYKVHMSASQQSCQERFIWFQYVTATRQVSFEACAQEVRKARMLDVIFSGSYSGLRWLIINTTGKHSYFWRRKSFSDVYDKVFLGKLCMDQGYLYDQSTKLSQRYSRFLLKGDQITNDDVCNLAAICTADVDYKILWRCGNHYNWW